MVEGEIEWMKNKGLFGWVKNKANRKYERKNGSLVYLVGGEEREKKWRAPTVFSPGSPKFNQLN